MVIHDFEQPEYAGPPRWARALIYTFTWFPFFWVLAVHVPHFEPIFAKVAAQGDLPVATGWLGAFARVNTSWHHLPVLLMVLALVAADEIVVNRLRRQARGRLLSWGWVVATGLAGIAALTVLLFVLLAPGHVLTA